MKPLTCFEINKQLEEAARKAEQRKIRAIERLTEKLGGRRTGGGRFEYAVVDVIDADKHTLQEKGQ